MELEDLVVSGKELNKRLVVEVLAPFVRLEQETCKIQPTPNWKKLRGQKKILVYLIARKAMRALDFPLEREEATPTEIISETGLPSGTVGAALLRLLNKKLVARTSDRKYYVPNIALEQIKDLLEKEVAK